MGRLQGKRAIVTGAGRGIGREIAAKFLEEGARTLICDIVADRIERAGQELGADGEVLALAGDVTDPAFCDELVARAVERFGRLDILRSPTYSRSWPRTRRRSSRANRC